MAVMISGTMQATRQPQTRHSWFHVAYIVGSFVFWLGPFFVTGWTFRDWSLLPRWLSFQHNAAGLFTRQSVKWWDHHLEVQRADGLWLELDEWQVFPMGAFGFRTRYDRILNESNRSPLRGDIRRRLADYVVSTIQAQPILVNHAEIKAIRLVRTLWAVGSPELANPNAAWQTPPLDQVPSTNRQTLAAFRIVEGRLIDYPKTPRLASPVKVTRPSNDLLPAKGLESLPDPKTRPRLTPPLPLMPRANITTPGTH